MAYQARHRDPLFDSETQAALARRSKELFGFCLIGLGVLTAMIVGTYYPDDPSWLSATDEPARNMLGRFGASIASPLFVIAGYASWGIALAFLVWGMRFVAHRGIDLAINRIIFVPIGVALLAVYMSTHMPPADWGHSFGLGGLFGDTVLGAVLGVVPIKATVGLKIMSLVMAAGTLTVGLYVLGCTRAEIESFFRFMLRGIVMVYDLIMRGLGRGAETSYRAMASARASRAERKAQQLADAEAAAAQFEAMSVEPAPSVVIRADQPMRAEPPVTAEHVVTEAPEQRQGILSKLTRKKPADVTPFQKDELIDEAQLDESLKARIAEAVRSRPQKVTTPDSMPDEAVIRKRHPRGPQPMILDQAARNKAVYEDLVDENAMPEPELVDQPTTMAADPVFETGRSVVQHAPKKAATPSRRAKAEAQPALQFEDNAAEYDLPPLSLLGNPEDVERLQLSDDALKENARMLEAVLDDYGVKGDIVSVRPGPVVTMYELEPAPGLKASRVIGLSDDIARSMSALSARVSTVPGRSVIGIELPNVNREKVVLREILATRDFGDGNQRLPLALGKDIGGDPIVANLAKMPHLLIAGTTGSGKSVAINTMILSLLYKLTPEECRLIMIDPKMLELSVYDGIPHLLSPVVTDPKKAVVALKWTVGEMEERYRKMSKMGVRNIEGYNGRVRDALKKGEMFSRTVQTGFDDNTGEPIFEVEEFAPETIPYIVVIVDEMADLMMVAGKEIEACIQRLAQMARASGIHLIMATQRPSVDVITGTIKANFPTRISFQVTSKVDSRTILGEQGAEQLLGMGDMLYMAGGAKITRIHGPFVADEEVEEIVTYLKQFGTPEYVGGVVEGPEDGKESDIDMVLGLGGNTDGEDALYDTAVQIVVKDRKCSTSYIQRKLAIGYNKAARLVEQMEESGLVSPANHVGKREILVPEQA
jgi:S-DNA-T family DNA segregation ATPase FtsK/SpoIIIE